ncbi:MAG: hypothetical protein IIV72_08320 [Alistipes sp.]|nr:hypothetical protein [Alistipes sp.]
MAHTEDGYEGVDGGFVWKALNTLLGAAGTATGITALASKEPKNNCHGHGHHGGTVFVNDGVSSPSAFQSWAKSCEDAIELTKAFYDARITQLGEARQAREIDTSEKFGLYKEMRDRDDVILARISNLETQVAVSSAVRPYQDALINCKIDKVADWGAFNLARRTCRMIEGEVVLPNTPTVTGYQSASGCNCNSTPANNG